MIGRELMQPQRDEKKKPKKWVLYIIVIFSVAVAYMGLGIYLDLTGVNTYISETKGVVAVNDFLDLKVGETQTAVYFVGSSIVGDGMDSEEINGILAENGSNIVTYNLGISADTPLQRSLSIQNIIDSKPSLVIFGETYNRVNSKTLNEENLFLTRDKLKLRADSLYLYTLEQLGMIIRPHTYLDDKRFVNNAKKYIPRGTVQHDAVITTDLFMLPRSSDWKTYRYLLENKNRDEAGIVKDAEKGTWSPKITKNMTPSKEALLYNVKTLQDAGIPVVILNMPLHPLVSAKVTEQSRKNYFELLDASGALWYDYEFACLDDDYWFEDGHHLAPYTGAKKFAPVIADLIMELEDNHVIHHA